MKTNEELEIYKEALKEIFKNYGGELTEDDAYAIYGIAQLALYRGKEKRNQILDDNLRTLTP